MKIVHLGRSAKKPTKKELERQFAERWILKQKAISAKKSMKLFQKEIEEIRQIDPEFMQGKLVQI